MNQEQYPVTQARLEEYIIHLYEEEKSLLTIEKYRRDINRFFRFAGREEVTKELLIRYKADLLEEKYAVASINSMLVALNRYFDFLGRHELKIKLLKCQKQIFCPEERELSREEYMRLVREAKGGRDEKMALILQTIAATGIRVGELKDITVEAAGSGKALVRSKNKSRTVFLPKKLSEGLMRYAKKAGIRDGAIFRTRSGRPVNRCNIWKKMKQLCIGAGVSKGKVFPHNLRHLFARMYYQVEKDIAKLSDLLGHSSIETTRIYIISSGKEHQRQIEKLNLIL